MRNGLIEEILKHRSLSIVGMEKNTGKTECLNYILRRVKNSGRRVAVTSIGIDGEECDQVTRTAKPEIELFEGMTFVTSEKHYREKQLTAVIARVGEKQTALGRLVTATALNSGKVLLSGPSDTASVRTLIEDLKVEGVDTVIVDGALSRMSPGAPTVTDAMVLATGAAVSLNMKQLVRKTKFVYDLICLPEASAELKASLSPLESGMWAWDESGEVHDLEIPSSFAFNSEKVGADIFRYGHRIFVAGAVGDKFLDFLRRQKAPVDLFIRDFTRMFVTPEVFYAFLKSGKRVQVLERSRLLAICINPQSPEGVLLNSDELNRALAAEVEVPVIDVRKTGE